MRYQLTDERVAQLVDVAETLLADIARGVHACTRHEPEAAQVFAGRVGRRSGAMSTKEKIASLLVVAGASAALDLYAKALARRSLTAYVPEEVVGAWFRLTLLLAA